MLQSISISGYTKDKDECFHPLLNNFRIRSTLVQFSFDFWTICLLGSWRETTFHSRQQTSFTRIQIALIIHHVSALPTLCRYYYTANCARRFYINDRAPVTPKSLFALTRSEMGRSITKGKLDYMSVIYEILIFD